MIPASAALHAAIKAGASQKTLLYFRGQDRWFGSKDIVLNTVQYECLMNSDEELTVGATPSASMNFSLVNDDSALSGFNYGWFTAYRGVQVDSDTYTMAGNASVEFDGDLITAYDTAPYLRVGNNAYAYQPDFAVKGLFVIEDVLYAVGTSYKIFVVDNSSYTWGDLKKLIWATVKTHTWGGLIGQGGSRTITVTDDGWWSQISRYVAEGVSVSITHDTTYEDNLNVSIYKNGTIQVFEYTPKGNFYADRPARTRTNVVEVEGHDAMYSVMEQMGDSVSVTWPTTLKGLLDAVCAAAGVTHKVNANSMINASMSISQQSDVFQYITLREALGLIAEASCAYAIFDYDGKLDLRWFTSTSLEIDEHDYVTFVPYEYEVAQIDKLQIRSSESDVGVLIGSGTNGYIIQDNPFLVFDSSSAGTTYGTPIYNRLAAFAEYIPSSCDWFADWTYQCGDLITITYKEEDFLFPIFNDSESWGGLTRGAIECSGSETRPVLNDVAREEYRVGRKITSIQKTVDGIVIDVSEFTTESEVAAMIAVSAGEIEAELSNYVTSSSLATTLSAYATSQSVSLTFSKIGASGYTATGITTITEDGITVTHSSLSGYKTVMDVGGFKLVNPSDVVVGGLMTVNGSVVTAMSTLYNVSYPSYSIWFGGIYGYHNGRLYGSHYSYGSTICGTTGIVIDSEYPTCFEINTDYDLLLDSIYQSIYLRAGEMAGIDVVQNTNFGDVRFHIWYNGQIETFTGSQLWEVINIVLP